MYKYQDKIKEINDESKVITKESLNQVSQIKNILSTGKIKDSSGLDYLFMNKIQKIQNKAIINSNNKSTYSNLLNHIPNTLRADYSQNDGNAYSLNQKYIFNNQDEAHSAFDKDEKNKELKTTFCNNPLALNINSGNVSPRMQSANNQTPNENNICEDINNKINLKDRNVKEYHLIKSKSNPNNRLSSHTNQQMYLKYSNVLMQNTKGAGILLPFENTQTKLNKNLTSDIISRTTCQTKNNSRKQSAEKKEVLIGQSPLIQSLEINNIPFSTKVKSGLRSSTKGSSSSLIKPKEDIYITKQSFYANPLNFKGRSNLSNAQIIFNDPLKRTIQNEILKSSQFNLTSRHFMNKNEIKYIDYVTSNIKNHSFKNAALNNNNKEAKRKEEIEKTIFQTKLMSIQQNKSLTTVQSKQNSKSTSRIEEYPKTHNASDNINDQTNNCINSLSNKNNLLVNTQLSISNKSTGIAIKKHLLQLETYSPVNKANKELVLYKDKINALKEDKQDVIFENNSEELKQDSLKNSSIENFKHLEIENVLAERILNETNLSLQSTVREALFYLREKEKIAHYINQYYSSNGVYPETQFSFYKYGRLIGKGAFGKVNLALHIGSGRLVAIKSFNKTKLRSKNAIPKIRHEINVLSKLQNPFISQ